MLQAKGKGSWPDLFTLERGFHVSAVDQLNSDYVCPGCCIRQVIQDQRRGWFVKHVECGGMNAYILYVIDSKINS